MLSFSFMAYCTINIGWIIPLLSFPKKSSKHRTFFVIGWDGGYKVIFLIEFPLEMAICLDLQSIRALTVANHGHPKIMGCRPEVDLGAMTKKLTIYSQESKERITSSNTPIGLTLDWSPNYRTIRVGVRLGKCNISMVTVVIIFTTTPWSINVFSMGTYLTWVVTTRLPGLIYFPL